MDAATETPQLPTLPQALAKDLPLTCVAGELESGDTFLLDGFCHPKFNCAPVTLTSRNYLNELQPVEHLFHPTCTTASAALPSWAHGAPVRDTVSSQNASSHGGATTLGGCCPCPETQQKEWFDKINDARRLVLCQIAYVVIGLYLT